jgi:hypothetical protein
MQMPATAVLLDKLAPHEQFSRTRSGSRPDKNVRDHNRKKEGRPAIGAASKGDAKSKREEIWIHP